MHMLVMGCCQVMIRSGNICLLAAHQCRCVPRTCRMSRSWCRCAASVWLLCWMWSSRNDGNLCWVRAAAKHDQTGSLLLLTQMACTCLHRGSPAASMPVACAPDCTSNLVGRYSYGRSLHALHTVLHTASVAGVSCCRITSITGCGKLANGWCGWWWC